MKLVILFLSGLFIARLCGGQNQGITSNRVFVQTPISNGHIADDRTVGIWEYYDTPGNLSLKIDYDNGEILYISPDSSDFFINVNGSWVKSKLTSPCRFHGPMSILSKHYDSARLAISFFRNITKPITAYLTFVVNENGIASHPEVVNDPEGKLSKVLMHAFMTAPNFWIPGQLWKEKVKCKMAIEFSICRPECSDKVDLKAKVLYPMNNTRGESGNTSIRLRSFNDFALQGLQWSPNDRSILFTSTDVVEEGINIVRRHDSGLVIHVESGEMKTIPYSQISRQWWLNNDSIYFKYDFESFSNQSGLYNLTSENIEPWRQSGSYYNIISTQHFKTAYITDSAGTCFLWEKGFKAKRPKLITKSRVKDNYFSPVAWSPDGSKLLFLEYVDANQENDLKLYDSGTNAIVYVPVSNAAFCGWSKSGNTLFLAKVKSTQYEIYITPYRYEIQSEEVIQLMDKSKNISDIRYSPVHDKLLILKKGDAYISGSGPGQEQQVLVKDIQRVSWSNNGEFIAYISKKDYQMHIMEYATRMTRKLSSWTVQKKK